MFASSRLSETGGGIHRRQLQCGIDAAPSLSEKCRRFPIFVRLHCRSAIEGACLPAFVEGAALEFCDAGSAGGISFMRVADAT